MRPYLEGRAFVAALAKEKEQWRREHLDAVWPAAVTAWRLCVVPTAELAAEIRHRHGASPAGEECILMEGSRGRCEEVYTEALAAFPHVGDGQWYLRKVRLEPYGEPLALGATS